MKAASIQPFIAEELREQRVRIDHDVSISRLERSDIQAARGQARGKALTMICCCYNNTNFVRLDAYVYESADGVNQLSVDIEDLDNVI